MSLTVAFLDALALRAVNIWLRLWQLRATELGNTPEWRRLVIGTLVELIQDAEANGRVQGIDAEPVNGEAIVPIDNLPRPRTPGDDEIEAAQRARRSVPRSADTAELTARVVKAVDTLVARDDAIDQRDNNPDTEVEFEAVAARVERMADAEISAAAQRGYQDGLEAKGIKGYRRGINPDCCELCYWLWREGYVYPIGKDMHQHPGCRCIPIPTTDAVGQHDLSEDEQALLDDLYARYKK